MSSVIDNSESSISVGVGASVGPDLRDARNLQDEELGRMRARLDDVTQQLLVARDAAAGADAERSVARARASELEHHLHVKTTEVEELAGRLLMLTEVKNRPPSDRAGAQERRSDNMIRRILARLSGRRRRADGARR